MDYRAQDIKKRLPKYALLTKIVAPKELNLSHIGQSRISLYI